MLRRSSDFWVATGLLVFCSLVAWRTTLLPSTSTGTQAGPTFFPWLMIVGIAILSIALLVRAVMNHGAGEGFEPLSRGMLARLAVFLVMMIAYAWAFEVVGYLPSTIAVFVAGMLLLGERNPVYVLLVPAIIVSAIYFGFTRLLMVWLP